MSDTNGRYEIRLRGLLASRWAARFPGMAVVPQDDGSTLVAGPVVDQAALHGLLRTVSDIGIPLLSVTRVDAIAQPTPAHPTAPSTPRRTP